MPGGVRNDPNTAVRFDGNDDAASAALDLSGKSAADARILDEVERLGQRRRPRLRVHAQLQRRRRWLPGRPQRRARQLRGRARRRRIAQRRLFARPSAGAWHHYAFVLDTTAPATQQIAALRRRPGRSPSQSRPAAPEPATSPTRRSTSCRATARRSSAPATSTRSRSTAGRWTPGRSAQHYQSFGVNKRPTASFQAPGFAQPGQQVNFDASASKDPDGTIAKYEWDLDGNGSYETDTGTTPTVSQTYATEGKYTIGLRVTDNEGSTATTTRALTVANNQPPTRLFQPVPNPAHGRPAGQLRRLGLQRPRRHDRQIRMGPRRQRQLRDRHRRDADGEQAPTPTAGDVTVGLRVTDDAAPPRPPPGPSRSTPASSRLRRRRQLDTPGLLDYWRLGEIAASTFADSVGPSPATADGRRRRWASPGAIPNDPDTAASFDGNDDAASAALDLSGTSAADARILDELERLRQRRPASPSSTRPTSTTTPAASWSTPTRRASGSSRSRSAAAPRATSPTSPAPAPAPGTTTPSSSTPRPRPHSRSFPTSTASRSPSTRPPAAPAPATSPTRRSTSCRATRSALFGDGNLDEVALYGRALERRRRSPSTTSSQSPTKPPAASFTAAPNPVADGNAGELRRRRLRATPTAPSPNTSGTSTATAAMRPTPATTPTASHVLRDPGRRERRPAGHRQPGNRGDHDPHRHRAEQPTDGLLHGAARPDADRRRRSTSTLRPPADPDGPIAKYEWDLDGNGSYETNTGATATASQSLRQCRQSHGRPAGHRRRRGHGDDDRRP